MTYGNPGKHLFPRMLNKIKIHYLRNLGFLKKLSHTRKISYFYAQNEKERFYGMEPETSRRFLMEITPLIFYGGFLQSILHCFHGISFLIGNSFHATKCRIDEPKD